MNAAENLSYSVRLWCHCWNVIFFFCVMILYDPVNNFSVMSGWVFMGWTSTKQWIKCLVSASSLTWTSNPPIPSLTLYWLSHCAQWMLPWHHCWNVTLWCYPLTSLLKWYPVILPSDINAEMLPCDVTLWHHCWNDTLWCYPLTSLLKWYPVILPSDITTEMIPCDVTLWHHCWNDTLWCYPLTSLLKWYPVILPSDINAEMLPCDVTLWHHCWNDTLWFYPLKSMLKCYHVMLPSDITAEMLPCDVTLRWQTLPESEAKQLLL